MPTPRTSLVDRARTRAAAAPRLLTGAGRAAVAALVLVGLVARLSPLLDVPGRLCWQYMTEDGYLMQTAARNLGTGHGLSTAEGTIPTNGVQPLATLAYAALHALAGGDKTAGIALGTLWSAAVAVAAAWWLCRVAERLLRPWPHARELAAVAAAGWFAAPQIVAHSMNGLETGLYQLSMLWALDAWLSAGDDGRAPLTGRRRLLLGALLGVAFLARNDAVFFIGGLLLAHLALGGDANGGPRRRLVDCLVAGATSVLVGLPWMAYNLGLFGSIVPISGISEGREGTLGGNLPWLAADLFESTVLWLPVPRALETTAPVILGSLLVVGAVLVLAWRAAARPSLVGRRAYVAALVFGLGICGYYGLVFGAPYFLPRYVSALSPMLWCGAVAAGAVLLHAACRTPRAASAVASGAMVALVVAAVAFSWRDWTRGTTHMHKQVVDWVDAHVPDDVWVGAIQTGTLGYFHDRTLNLDGKVNPDALRAILDDGHVLNYVIASPIEVLADWEGIAGWLDLGHLCPEFPRRFELVVRDEAADLGVLRRVH